MSDSDIPGHPRVSSRPARFAGAAVGILCTFGLVLVITALVVRPADMRMRDLAVDLEAIGASAVVTDVEPGSVITFTKSDGEPFTATIASSGEPPALEVGTPVVYLPVDPSKVMAASDLPYYINDAVPAGTSVLLIGLTPCALTAAAWAMTRRHPWWRNVVRFVPHP